MTDAQFAYSRSHLSFSTNPYDYSQSAYVYPTTYDDDQTGSHLQSTTSRSPRHPHVVHSPVQTQHSPFSDAHSPYTSSYVPPSSGYTAPRAWSGHDGQSTWQYGTQQYSQHPQPLPVSQPHHSDSPYVPPSLNQSATFQAVEGGPQKFAGNDAPHRPVGLSISPNSSADSTPGTIDPTQSPNERLHSDKVTAVKPASSRSPGPLNIPFNKVRTVTWISAFI